MVSLLGDLSATKLSGSDGVIHGLAFDPEGSFLASVSDRSVKIWGLDRTRPAYHQVVASRDITRGEKANDMTKTMTIDWQPSGRLIAVPVANRVLLYERDTWECRWSPALPHSMSDLVDPLSFFFV